MVVGTSLEEVLMDNAERKLSCVNGPALEEEPALGALTLSGFFAEVCERHAAREALVYRDADGQMQRWSYTELMQQSRAVAKALTAGGLCKGARVGIMMTNRPEWVAAAFGIAMAGGVVVALNTFATPREFEFFIRQADCSVLLLEETMQQKNFLADLRQFLPEISQANPGNLQFETFPSLRRVVVLGDSQDCSGVEPWSQFISSAATVSEQFCDAIANAVCEADEAVVFFSSGSTALPKGIRHNHRAVAIQCWRWARLLELQSDVRAWTPNGFFWSGNFCVLLGATLAVGGCVVLQPYFNADEALDLLVSEKISYPFVWPHQMADLVAAPGYMEADLSSFYYVDADWPFSVNPTVIDNGWRYPGNSFGCSETITINCSYPASTPLEIREKSHGIPMPGNTLAIVDVMDGRPVPLGEHGEIAIKGATLMTGYLRVPLDMVLDENGFYRTGDGGYIDDRGRLIWQGRLNDVIKTGGANVSPQEVDTILMKYGGIKAAHTVGVEHDTLGEMAVACIVPMAGNTIDENGLNAFLRENLASYKRPRELLLLKDEDLTFTANNKIKIDALRELAAERLASR